NDSETASNLARSICDIENSRMKKTSMSVIMSEYVTIHLGAPDGLRRLGYLRFMDTLSRKHFMFILCLFHVFFGETSAEFFIENTRVLARLNADNTFDNHLLNENFFFSFAFQFTCHRD